MVKKTSVFYSKPLQEGRLWGSSEEVIFHKSVRQVSGFLSCIELLVILIRHLLPRARVDWQSILNQAGELQLDESLQKYFVLGDQKSNLLGLAIEEATRIQVVINPLHPRLLGLEMEILFFQKRKKIFSIKGCFKRGELSNIGWERSLGFGD